MKIDFENMTNERFSQIMLKYLRNFGHSEDLMRRKIKDLWIRPGQLYAYRDDGSDKQQKLLPMKCSKCWLGVGDEPEILKIMFHCPEDENAKYCAEISPHNIWNVLTEESGDILRGCLEDYLNAQDDDSELIAEPTHIKQLAIERVNGEKYTVKTTSMMTVKTNSYANKVVKRGTTLTFETAYMGKRKGAILVFRKNDKEQVEIPFLELEEKLEDGKELKRLLMQKPDTRVPDNTGFYSDDEDFGVWA